jgi:predicted dehydrogenase
MKTKFTRRHFLQSTLLAGAAPLILPSSARSSVNRSAPGDRITLGFIGVGRQGHALLDTFLRKKDTQVVAVCDVDTTRREHARKTVNRFYAEQTGREDYEDCTASNDFLELLARDDVDGVVVATPDHWHAIPVVRAAEAGKDIYCETPLSLTVREARVMANAVRNYERVCQTGSQQRSMANFRLACELVRNGRIGQVKSVHVGVGGPSDWCDLPETRNPAELDWNRWLGPAPYRGWSEVLSPVGVHQHYPRWRNYREYTGGGMTDWGAHHFDIAQWGLGMDHTGPVEIIPPEGRHIKLLTYRYANGIDLYHIQQNGVTFTGTEGTIHVNRGVLESVPDSLIREPLHVGDMRLPVSEDHLQNWLDCMRTREKPICDVEIGARSATVCHLGNLAYWNKKPLRWNPQIERFAGENGNNRWLDVERRNPWVL